MILQTEHTRRQRWIIKGLLALMALMMIGWKFGLQVLDPTHDSWLYFLGSDITPDYFAWIFYRDTPWELPIGVIENYSYPVRTSIGLTGGIPLFAVPFKILSPILPETFQYYGWWFLMNYVLQGWAGVYILRVLKVKNMWLLLLGGAFFMLSPPFLDRHPHANLTAHWVLLFSLGTALAHARQISPKTKIWIYGGLMFASVWIHPYLVLFPLAFSMADWLKSTVFEREGVGNPQGLRLSHIIIWPLVTAFGLIAGYYGIGYDMLPSDGALSSGFGAFSANLNTFFNSMDRMALIPGMPLAFVPPGSSEQSPQYEGFAYLGAGMIVLLLFGFFLLVWKRPYIARKTMLRMIPIGLAALGLFILALSNIITFEDRVLLEVPMNDLMERMGSTFRASGRYVWASHYLIYALVIWVLVKKISIKPVLLITIGAALVLQVIDVSPYVPSQDIYPHGPYATKLESPAWEEMFDKARLVVMEPAYARNFAMFGDDMYFIRLAHDTKTPITAGHLARYDNRARNRMRDTIRIAQESGQLPSNFERSLFVSPTNESGRFNKLIGSGALKAFAVDGYVMYVPQALLAEASETVQNLPSFRGREELPSDFLERHRDSWVFLSVKDEGSYRLCDTVKQYMKLRGGTLHDIQFRMPYLGVLHKGKVLHDSAYASPGPFTFAKNKSENIKGVLLPGSLKITSGGGDSRACKIEINGQDFAINERGLNLVAADSAFNVLERGWYDTFEQCGKWLLVEPNL
ncbi:MAG: DUF6311 domain-containing protein [Bacteroidia bacterium]